MKLLRCDLRAFGGFKNKTIEFDPQKNFHFIYGDNEAGKTTFTRALLALLFGIEKKTPDAYHTSQEHLYLEGIFETKKGQILQVQRQHKLSKKLNLELQNLFPNLNKARYAQHFILNEETLQTGSKELLVHLKDFDLSFFSHSTGLFQIKKLIQKLELQSEALFKERGAKPLINHSFHLYDALVEKEKNQLLTYEDYELLQKQIQILENEKNNLLKKEKEREKNEQALIILQEFYSALHDLEQVRVQIKELEKKAAHFDPPFQRQSSHRFSQEWATLKKELLALLEGKRELEVQLVGIQERIESPLKEKEKISQQLSGFTQNNNVNLDRLEERLQEFKKNENIELYISQKEKNLEQLREEIEKKLFKLKFEKKTLLTCLEISLPSSQEEEQHRLANLELQYKKKHFLEKKKQLEAEKRELTQKQAQLTARLPFDLKGYQKTKKERLELEQTILLLNPENSSKAFFSKFNKYRSLVHSESEFTELILNESDAFAQYQETFYSLKKISHSLEKEDQNYKKWKKIEEGQLKFLLDYQKKWNHSSLNFELFYQICDELPSIQTQVKEYLEEQKKIENFKEKAQLMRAILKKWLGEQFQPKASLKDLIALFEAFWIQSHQEKDRKKELLLFLKSVDKELSFLCEQKEKVQKKISEEKKKWQLFLSKWDLKLDYDEKMILQSIEEMEAFFLLVKEKSYLEKIVLKEKLSHVKQFYIKVQELVPSFNTEKKDIPLLSTDPEFAFPENIFRIEERLKNHLIKEQQNSRGLQSELSDLDQQLGQLHFQMKMLRDEESSKTLEVQMQNLFSDIESQVENYLTYELSLFLIKKQIKEYQEKTQEPIIKKMGVYFSQLTSQKYTKVSLNILGKDSFLTCHTKEQQVEVQDLSRGTRDQLFLSLKLAFIEKFLESQEPLPIILDDILVQFDEKRSVEALKTFQTLSKETQLVFLTHHAHIIELAQRELNPKKIQIHTLHDKEEAFKSRNILHV